MISNYIAHLNGYRERRKVDPLTTNEIALYYILLEYCNEIGWIDWFTAANGVLQGLSGLSRSAFHRARGELARLGYIKYRDGAGNQSGKYLIVDFGTQTGTQSGTQMEHKQGRKVEPLTKPKTETKTKEKDTNVSQKKFVPPSLDEIRAYCKEQGYRIDPKRFFDYFAASDWVDSTGKPVRSWKQKIITWDSKSGTVQSKAVVAKNYDTGDDFLKE